MVSFSLVYNTTKYVMSPRLLWIPIVATQIVSKSLHSAFCHCELELDMILELLTSKRNGCDAK